jgi:hypothetical protein
MAIGERSRTDNSFSVFIFPYNSFCPSFYGDKMLVHHANFLLIAESGTLFYSPVWIGYFPVIRALLDGVQSGGT